MYLFIHIYLFIGLYLLGRCTNLWVEKIPLREKWQPTPAILLAKSHRQKSTASYSPWSRKIGHNLVTKQQHLYITFFSFFVPVCHMTEACAQTDCILCNPGWEAISRQWSSLLLSLNSFPYAEKFTNLPMADVLGV